MLTHRFRAAARARAVRSAGGQPVTLTHRQGSHMQDDGQATPRDAPAATVRTGHQRNACAEASSAQAQHEQDRALASGEENPT